LPDLSYAEGLAFEYDAPCALSKVQPHEIAFSPKSRVVADSAKLGWRDAYAAITARRAWSGAMTPIEHLGIGYCLRGANRIERRLQGEEASQIVPFRARQLAILPSHTPATFKVTGDADVLILYLRAGLVRAVADRLLGASNAPLHFRPEMGFSDPLLEQYCLSFADALYRPRGEGSRFVDQLAESTAAHCLMRYLAEDEAPSPPAAQVDTEAALGRVAAYVDEHLDGDLSVERLAREAGLACPALTRAFASVHGLTPRQWIIRRRLAYAERMLAGTDLPLAEIALRAGFASQSHLGAAFKREIGRTPADYRRAQ
jgi:AraC family transcriptional regulator